jgi:hypothetical protein
VNRELEVVAVADDPYHHSTHDPLRVVSLMNDDETKIGTKVLNIGGPFGTERIRWI